MAKTGPASSKKQQASKRARKHTIEESAALKRVREMREDTPFMPSVRCSRLAKMYMKQHLARVQFSSAATNSIHTVLEEMIFETAQNAVERSKTALSRAGRSEETLVRVRASDFA